MKNKLKILGNIIVILAIIFVIKRFFALGIDLKIFATPKAIIAMVLAMAIQVFTLCVGCFPWLRFVECFSGKKIPFFSAMTVYTKANIYKYLPGNVFQYVGRNELAAKMDISHVDVACSTILDIICGLIPSCIFSAIMLRNYVLIIMSDYWQSALIVILLGFSALIVSIICVFIFRSRITNYLERYKKIFNKYNKKKIVEAAYYYTFVPLISIAVDFIIAYLLFDGAGIEQFLTITGAYIFAWILGYVTPGAPGGIGIRESVMLIVCGGMFEENVMIYALLFRISSIFADILGFIIGRLCEKKGINRSEVLR